MCFFNRTIPVRKDAHIYMFCYPLSHHVRVPIKILHPFENLSRFALVCTSLFYIAAGYVSILTVDSKISWSVERVEW